MQIQHGESAASQEPLDAPNPILAEHENPQIDEGVNVRDEVEAIVVEVQEDKPACEVVQRSKDDSSDPLIHHEYFKPVLWLRNHKLDHSDKKTK